MKKKSKGPALITWALIAAVYAGVFAAEQLLPATSMLFTVLKKGATYALVAVSMNLLNGFTGIFSLGQAGFMLIGAYVYGIFTIPVADRPVVYQYYDGGLIQFTVPVVVALVLAGLAAALFAFLSDRTEIGRPRLRRAEDADQLVHRRAVVPQKEPAFHHLRRVGLVVDLDDEKRRISGQGLQGGGFLVAVVVDIQQIDHALIFQLRLPLKIEERADSDSKDEHKPHKNGNELQPQPAYHIHGLASGAVR